MFHANFNNQISLIYDVPRTKRYCMNIRLATLHDIDAICPLYQQFYETNSKQQPMYYCNAEENGSYPKGVLNGTNGDIFIAETQNEMISFIHVEAHTIPFRCTP